MSRGAARHAYAAYCVSLASASALSDYDGPILAAWEFLSLAETDAWAAVAHALIFTPTDEKDSG